MEKWRSNLQELSDRGMLRSLRLVEGSQGPRIRVDGQDVLLLCSNNYLGLAGHPAVIAAARRGMERLGAGSGGSRLISGSMESHRRLEERLAAFKGTSRALLFNSGYAANIGVLQGLFGPDDTIFSDQLNHASIIDGCRLSRARTLVYPHGNLSSLEELMRREQALRSKGRWLIVTDGVFSMDGDLAPLHGLVELKRRFDALLMVDDAHGTGVLGSAGRGTAEFLGCAGDVDLHMGTLGKALGGFGAFLAGPDPAIDTLINHARSFIFSTSLPPAVPEAALAALDIVESDEGAALRKSLKQNRQHFVARLLEGGLAVPDNPAPIVPIVIGDPEPTMAASARLFQQGIFVQGIRPPTVPGGSSRLRATLMANHAIEDLDRAAGLIVQELRG
ncbi:MAG: 8-amino-7-oxononanoate synthase [Syntrophotaleaceae bacterium]